MKRFLSGREDLPYKVILFTKKKKTSRIIKGLTAEYFNRLPFAEVHISQKKIVKEFGVESFPQIVVVRVGGDGTKDIVRYDGDLKFGDLKTFLDGYALEKPSIKGAKIEARKYL